MTRVLRRICASVFLPLLLSGCAGDFIARRVDPLPAAAKRFGGSAANDSLLSAAVAAQRAGQTDRAVCLYARALDRSPQDIRRFVISRLIELCAPRLLGGARSLDFADASGRCRIFLQRGSGGSGVDPSSFAALEPTDRYAVSRTDVKSGRPGPGATLIGEVKPLPAQQPTTKPSPPISGLCWAVTALAQEHAKDGVRNVTLELYEPHEAAGLAADFTAPLAVSHSRTKKRNFAFAGFLHGDRFFGNAGLYSLQAPAPDKTPVILVHGLVSYPGAFRRLNNMLVNDPQICRRYQIWFFFYPTSLPIPTSAALLRDALAKKMHELDPGGIHPELHRIVLIGHSMGGLVARLVSSDSNGDAFYHNYFRAPVAELKMKPDVRAKLRDSLFFRRSPDVRTAIFIATPHRGSSLAASPVGYLAQMLVSLPALTKKNLATLTSANRSALADPALARESSVFGLGPNSPSVKALASAPLATDQVTFYSIIGNRGRRGPLEGSSDGVVPYASSHLPQAKRETIVPAGHTGTLEAKETFAEVARILKENGD